MREKENEEKERRSRTQMDLYEESPVTASDLVKTMIIIQEKKEKENRCCDASDLYIYTSVEIHLSNMCI